MKEKDIQRINELAHKSKKEGLTPEEKKEQQKLRGQFLADIRANMRAQLDNISILEPDGSITKPGENRKRRTDR